MQLYNVPGYTIEGAGGLPEGAILISIQEEWGPNPKIDHITCPILAVKFSDVEAPLEHGEETLNPISKEIAAGILGFCQANSGKTTCVVHCAAGVSRSASVVLALHICLGWRLPRDFWKHSLPKPQTVGAIVLEWKHAEARSDDEMCGITPRGSTSMDAAISWKRKRETKG